MDWNEFLQQTAQDLIGHRADQAIAPVSAPPVAQTSQGLRYVEGQPSSVAAAGKGLDGTIFGLPKMYVIGGGAAIALLGAFLMFKK